MKIDEIFDVTRRQFLKGGIGLLSLGTGASLAKSSASADESKFFYPGKIVSTSDFCISTSAFDKIIAAHKNEGEGAGLNEFHSLVNTGECYLINDTVNFKLNKLYNSFIHDKKLIQVWSGVFVGEGMSTDTYYIGVWIKTSG